MGIGGKGERGIGKRKDSTSVHGPVAVLVPAGDPQPDLCPAGQTSISSIPASCAQASFTKNGSGVFMEVSLKVYMGWCKDEGCGEGLLSEIQSGKKFPESCQVVHRTIASSSNVRDLLPLPGVTGPQSPF